MAAKDDLGRAGEQRAVDHLVALGLEILDRNWRAGGGELDIVARDGGEIVVVEVKARSGDGFGHPLEAVGERKLTRLRLLAFAWCAAHASASRRRGLRIDVIGITGPDPASGRLEHLRDVA